MKEKVRFGIIGTGRISDWVLKGAVLEPRFEAAAVCSRSAANGEAFAAAHGIPKVFTDVDLMASDPSIDVVYIGTPNNTHKDLAVRCMRLGKNVLCEKPLASNAREVQEMISVAKDNGVLLMEAMISTLSPNFLNVQRVLGSLGSVRHYFAAFCQYSSKYDLLKRILAGEDSSPVPSSFNPDCSGGALTDVGIYPIYPMVALFGKPSGVRANITTCKVPVGGFPLRGGSAVSQASPAGTAFLVNPEPGLVSQASSAEASDGKVWKKIDLQGSVVFDYPGGMTATILYSKIADSTLRTEISCDGGILSLDQIHITRQVNLIKRGAPTSGRGSGPEAVDITVPRDADEYRCEFREFIDVLQGRQSGSGSSFCSDSDSDSDSDFSRKGSANNSLANSLAVAETMDEIRRQAGVIFPAD